MRILLISDVQEIKELLSFHLSSQFPVNVKESSSAVDGIEQLKKNEKDFDLLIAPYNGGQSAVVQFLRDKKSTLPAIFYFDPLVAVPDDAALAGISVLGTIEKSDLVEGSARLIKEFRTRGGDAAAGETDADFCPIRTNLLIRATPLKSDIYIRLNKEKFVKLFRVGDEFDNSDLQRYYEEKGVEYMYLRRHETAEFVEKFRKELESLLARKDLPKEEAIQASEMSHEAIHELVQRVGFTPEVQELARKNVELTLKSVGQNPKLAELIQRVTKEGNYLSQHSTLLAHVACCVAKEMEWGSDATFSKLVLAAFMHDIAVTDPKLAMVNNLRELEARKAEFPADQVKAYHSHPTKAAELVRSMQEIPADVDQIVHHHHERPNGSGFPRGLSQNYIAPLSCVFIIAHDLTQEILFKGEQFSLPAFIQEKKPQFPSGNFKKVMAALEKMKL